MPALEIAFCSPSPVDHGEGPNRRLENAARWDVIYDIARERGHRVRVLHNEPLPPDFPGIAGVGAVVISCNVNWYPAVERSLLERQKEELPLTAIWHNEPLPAPRAARLPMQKLYRREVKMILLHNREADDIYTNAWRLKTLLRRGIPDVMITSSQDRCDYLAERGFLAHRVPIGHASLLRETPPPNNAGDERDIDVLFIGAQSLRHRNETVQEIKDAGINIVSLGDYNKDNLWGEERDHLIRRTKIFLNLQRYPVTLPGLRFLIGMTNRAMIVSDPLYQPLPYVSGEHLIEAPRAELSATLRRFLDDHAAREHIANSGYEFAKTMTPRRLMTKIIDHLEARYEEYAICKSAGRTFVRGAKLQKRSA